MNAETVYHFCADALSSLIRAKCWHRASHVFIGTMEAALLSIDFALNILFGSFKAYLYKLCALAPLPINSLVAWYRTG